MAPTALSPLPAPRVLRALLILLAIGATLGSALDGIHTHFGATQYPQPLFWQMAWWTPLLFAAAFAIGALRPFLDRYQRATPPPRPLNVTVTMAAFVAAYFSSVLALAWPYVSLLLLLHFALAWLASDRSPLTLAIALAAAVGGPTVEAILVSAGAFVHLQPTYFGLPGWLPFLYLSAAVALTTLARFLSAPSITE